MMIEEGKRQEEGSEKEEIEMTGYQEEADSEVVIEN